MLEGAADAGERNLVRPYVGQVLTVEHDVAGGRAIDTVDAIKQGCLTRSVWANDREQFAIVGLEADTVECGKAAEL